MSTKKQEGVIRSDRLAISNPNMIQIVPGFNCRTTLGDLTELQESIKAHGILADVWVRPDPANKQQPYILIAGERRLTCAQKLWTEGVKDLRVPIKVFYVDEVAAEDLMALENLERENLSFEDEANLMNRWCKRGFTIDEVAAKVQRSRTWVEQRLTLAAASATVKAMVSSGEVPLRVGVQVAANTPAAQQNATINKIVKKAKGKKSKMQAASDEILGLKTRPGKKLVMATIRILNAQELAKASLKTMEVRSIVMMAMQYAVGDVTEEQFLEQWNAKVPVNQVAQETADKVAAVSALSTNPSNDTVVKIDSQLKNLRANDFLM